MMFYPDNTMKNDVICKDRMNLEMFHHFSKCTSKEKAVHLQRVEKQVAAIFSANREEKYGK